MEVYRGKVLFTTSKNGRKMEFGFIKELDGNFDKDIFFYYNDIIPESENEFKILHEGDIVSFNTQQREKGLGAINIRKVDKL